MLLGELRNCASSNTQLSRMMKKEEFQMASRIVLNSISYHGHGAIENIVPELQNHGKKKVFVCTDASLIKFGVAKKVTDLGSVQK